jgi:hypothetical protein
MKKRVIISEEQFKRVFLSEQNPPKKKGKSAGAQAAPPSPFPNSKYNVNPLPIEDLFNYHIKNKSDGDNFRSWVRSDSKRLNIVNKELSKNGFTDGLSKSGEYNGDYVRIAWRTVGQDYLNYKNKKGVEDYKKDDYAGLDTQHPNYKRQFKLPDVNNPAVDSFKKPAYEKYKEYKNYKSALSNWVAVNSYFGWTGEKTVSSSQISNILNAKIDFSTCIDPSYIINKLEELKYEMITSALSFGVVGSDEVERILTSRAFDDNLKNYFGDLSIGLKPKQPEKMVDKTYTGGPRDKKDIITQVLDPEGGLGASYYQNLRNIDSFNALNQTKYDNDLKDYEQKVELQKKLDNLGSAFTENLIFYNKYDKVLEIIDEHNIIISLQTKERHENACSDPVYKTVSIPVGYGAPGSGGHSPSVDETFKWSDACKNNGGMFMIPSTPSVRTAGMSTIGFTDNKTICCCVKSKGTAKVNVNGVDSDYVIDINIADWCGKSIGDVRGGWEKVEDWGADCATDWHCIADIASIVSLAFGPAGLLVSALIDLVSAIGYVAEGEEGWEINAGLTALGAFGGLGEALKLAGKGTKFASKLGELGRITARHANDLITLEREVAIWSRTLNADELKMFDAFKDLLKKVNDPRYRDLITDLNRQGGNLDPIQKGILGDIFRKESPTEIERLYNVAGKDLNKMVNSYFKGFRQLIVQGSLFAGLYVYSEDIAKGLQNLYLNYGFDPLGVFSDTGEIDEKEISPDYLDILSNDEKIDLLAEKLSEGGFINTDTYVEETKLLSDFSIKISQILKSNISNSLLNSVTSLKKEVSYQIDGKRYEHKDIKEVMDLVNPILDGIINKSVSESESIKKITNIIVKLKGIEKPNISREEKTAVIATGNKELTPEDLKTFQNFLLEVNEEVDGDVDNENNKNESYNKSNMKLNEEINRIKSLFTNERLYGNLVNEVCDNEGDAIALLQGKGYIVRAGNEGDLCLGPGTELGVIYEKYKNDTTLSFQSGTSPDGCYLGIFRKTKVDREQHFYLVNLFEKGLNEKNRFNMYYMFNDYDACEKVVTVGGRSLKIIITKDGYDTATGEFGSGLKFVKIEGEWTNDGSEYKLSNTVIVKLMDKDNKKIKLSHNINISGVNIPIDLSSLTDLDNTTGGSAGLFKGAGGTCLTLSEFLNEKWADYNNGFTLSDLISKIKI